MDETIVALVPLVFVSFLFPFLFLSFPSLSFPFFVVFVFFLFLPFFAGVLCCFLLLFVLCGCVVLVVVFFSAGDLRGPGMAPPSDLPPP